MTRSVTLVLWTAATAIGYSLGLYVGFLLAHVMLGPVMAAACMGAGVGLLQRPVVQSLLEPRRSRAWTAGHSAWWILGSVAGIVIAVVAWLLITELMLDPEEVEVLGAPLAILCFAIGGALTGLLQTRTLRAFVRRPGLWIGISAGGWGLSALGLALAYELSNRIYPLLALLLGPAAGGAIVGLVTGSAMVTRQRIPPADLEIP